MEQLGWLQALLEQHICHIKVMSILTLITRARLE